MDFQNKTTLSVPDPKTTLGGVLLEYYICNHLIIPFAMGPFPRTDLQINLHCQTEVIAKQIRNWQFHDQSLRQLGWLCTQQHVHLISSGPRIKNINFSSYTNSLFQVYKTQESQAVHVTPMEMNFGNEQKIWNSLESDQEQELLTNINSRRGQNFAACTTSEKKLSTSSIQMNRMILYGCLLQQVAWGSDPAHLCPLKPSVASECLPLKVTTKRLSTTRLELDSAWTWASKAINAHTPLPLLKDSHLVPCLCGSWEKSSWPKVAHNSSSSGGVDSWGSSLSVEPEKSGGLSKNKTVITSSCGKTSRTDMACAPKENLMIKQIGSTFSSPPRKGTDIKRELRFDLEKTRIRCYVPSKPFGGYRKEETTSRFGIETQAEFLKSKGGRLSIAKPSSIASRRWPKSLGWTRLESPGTLYESVQPLNSWPLDSTPRSLNSWAGGARTAICGICV